MSEKHVKINYGNEISLFRKKYIKSLAYKTLLFYTHPYSLSCSISIAPTCPVYGTSWLEGSYNQRLEFN